MTTPSNILRWKTEPRILEFYCPGCKAMHQIDVYMLTNERRVQNAGWNGSFDKPTISQNFQVYKGSTVCLYSMRLGQLTYRAESTHDLAGQTVDMIEIPSA